MVFIEVLCTNGHRVKVNCTPNTSLRQILEDACHKKSLLPVDDYGLKYNGKILDLSQPLRFTGLINNSKVEMVKVEQSHTSQILVAVQLESGERLHLNVDPITPLTEVFDSVSRTSPEYADHFSVASHPNLTPVVVHFREEIIGTYCLANTSLKSLGLKQGKTVLRFFWRKDAAEAAASAEKALRSRLAAVPASHLTTSNVATTVAPSIIPSVNFTTPSTSRGADASGPSQAAQNEESFSWFWDPPKAPPAKRQEMVSQFNSSPFCQPPGATNSSLANFKFPEETAGKNLYQNELSTKKVEDIFKCDRRPVWYSPSQSTKTFSASSASDPLPDSFFALTEDDMKKMMTDLRKRVIEETESPLMTASMRTAARVAKYAKYNYAVIRFVFHDGIILQAVFNPQETTYHLYKFIRKELTHSKFILYTTPPKKTVKDCADTLIEANLVPLSRVYVGGDVEASGAVVRPDMHLHSEKDAKDVVMDCLKAMDAENEDVMSRNPSARRREDPSGASTSESAKQKQVPKWFKTSR